MVAVTSSLGRLYLCLVISSSFAAQAAAQDPAGAQEFRVGFASRTVDTSRVIPMGGYGTYVGLPSATRTNGVGTHDSLYARAMSIQGATGHPLVIVSVDAVGISSVSAKRIKEKAAQKLAGMPVHVIVSATHTHHSPDTMGLWGALPFFTGRDSQYMKKMEEGAAEAISQALRGAEPAHLEYALSSKPNSHSDEANPALRDDGIVTLHARAMDGRTLGTLTQWSAHPTILGAENNALSSDFPGVFRHHMDRHFGGTHVYVNGMLGNSYVSGAREVAEDPFKEGRRDPDVGDGYERVAATGWDLYSRVSTALQAATPLTENVVEVKNAPVRVPNQNGLFKWAIAFKIIEKPAMVREDIQTDITWFRIGDLQGASVPGEMFPSGTTEIRALLANGNAKASLIVGIGNDWLGYLMKPEEFDDPRFKYHKQLSPGKSTVPILIEAYRALLDRFVSRSGRQQEN